MSKVTQLVDKVKVLINPELAGKGGRVIKGTALGGILGTLAGGKIGADIGGAIRDARIANSDTFKKKVINHLFNGPMDVLNGLTTGAGTGLVGGAVTGGALGYAAKRAAINRAKDAQRKVLMGAAGIGGAGTIGGGVYYLGNKK